MTRFCTASTSRAWSTRCSATSADGDILEYDGASFRAYKAYNWQQFSEVWGVRQGDAQTTLGGFSSGFSSGFDVVRAA